MEKRIKEILALQPSEDTIKAEGWVRTKRDSKNVSFIEINDGSCLKGLQAVLDRSAFPDDLVARITTGCSVSVTGRIVKSEGGSQDIEHTLDRVIRALEKRGQL